MPPSDTMSSLTSEHYGVIGIALLLHIVCIQYNITQAAKPIRIYVHNAEVISRGRNHKPIQNVGGYLVADFDLWKVMQQLLDTLPISVNLIWVASHQDENESGQTISRDHTNATFN